MKVYFVCSPFLASLLQFFPQLEDMDVSWNELIGGSLTTLTSHLQHVGGIRTLKLCSCRLDTDDVAALGETSAESRAIQ